MVSRHPKRSKTPKATLRTALALLLGLPLAASTIELAHAQDNRAFQSLSERERTFLFTVMRGNEAKATEYAEIAGINANSIGGHPLSAWFYSMGGGLAAGQNPYMNLNVHRIIFGRFHQDPNPKIGNNTHLGTFCSSANIPINFAIENGGNEALKRQLHEQQAAAGRAAIDAMAAAFDFLVRHGLRDRNIIQQIFAACYFANAGARDERNAFTAYAYDALITKLIKAGADVNVPTIPAGKYAIEQAVAQVNAPIVQQLIRDGANVNVHVRPVCPNRNVQSNLYAHLFDYVTSPMAGQAIEIVKILSRAGLSPYAKTASGGCRERSLYDYAVDKGQLDFARAVKEAAASAPAPGATRPTQTAPATAASQANMAPIGDWHLGSTPGGRPFAASTTAEGSGRALKELRLECVPGGRLEYVPVTSSGAPVQALWFEGSNTPIAVSKGRVVGPAAVQLSKEFLAEEEGRAPDDEWFVALVVNAPSLGSKVRGRGFAETRKYLLANCKQ